MFATNNDGVIDFEGIDESRVSRMDYVESFIRLQNLLIMREIENERVKGVVK